MDQTKNAANAATETQANAETSGQTTETENQASEVNARLLAESKKYKSAYQEAKQKLEEVEKSKLQEQSKYKELYEQTEEKYKTLYKSLVKEKVRTSVADVAAKAGCHDVEALLKLGNSELLQVDDESLKVDGVEAFVEDARKNKPYLFQSVKQASINSVTPGGGVTKTKSLKDMSSTELMAQLRSLK